MVLSQGAAMHCPLQNVANLIEKNGAAKELDASGGTGKRSALVGGIRGHHHNRTIVHNFCIIASE